MSKKSWIGIGSIIIVFCLILAILLYSFIVRGYESATHFFCSLNWTIAIISIIISIGITFLVVRYRGILIEKLLYILIPSIIILVLWWLLSWLSSDTQDNFTGLIVPAFLSVLSIYISKMQENKKTKEDEETKIKRTKVDEEVKVKKELYAKMINAYYAYYADYQREYREPNKQMSELNGMVYVYCKPKISSIWKGLQEEHEGTLNEKATIETLIEEIHKDLDEPAICSEFRDM
ncbi:MAG: hypothetical protein FWD99_06280 [Oscillospiraceae bacterium]|nr:hypothetical protein [Oscillospiraceae bacterium]